MGYLTTYKALSLVGSDVCVLGWMHESIILHVAVHTKSMAWVFDKVEQLCKLFNDHCQRCITRRHMYNHRHIVILYVKRSAYLKPIIETPPVLTTNAIKTTCIDSLEGKRAYEERSSTIICNKKGVLPLAWTAHHQFLILKPEFSIPDNRIVDHLFFGFCLNVFAYNKIQTGLLLSRCYFFFFLIFLVLFWHFQI